MPEGVGRPTGEHSLGNTRTIHENEGKAKVAHLSDNPSTDPLIYAFLTLQGIWLHRL